MSAADRKAILDRAAECVLKDRNATHGEAEDNFRTIAEYWTTHLRARGLLRPDVKVDREDVALMSGLIKTARLAQSFDHADNWIDSAGYAACGGGIAAERKAWTIPADEIRNLGAYDLGPFTPTPAAAAPEQASS